MDKKTILGIVVVAVLFLGFAYVNTKQQEKYQQEMAAWQAYQDSVAAASRLRHRFLHLCFTCQVE